MDEILRQKLKQLEIQLKSLGSIAIAFSGGVDSTFLAKIAHDVLNGRAVALTVDSEAYPPSSIVETRSLAHHIGIKLVEIPASVTSITGFVTNQPDRCYHCKKALFTLMIDRAHELGFQTIADGSNMDDLSDYRPGERALEELGVISPLKQAGFTKQDIRALSRERGLPTWNRQSFACLASRFPYGTIITAELLERVGKAEQALRELGLARYRVRHHGDIARIEVAPEDMPLLLDPANREKMVTKLKSLGYAYITLDLQGFRTGSMNEVLGKRG